MTGEILLWTLLALPLLGAAACMACRTGRAVMEVVRAGVLVIACAGGILLGITRFGETGLPEHGLLCLDSLSAYHLAVMLMVFALSSLYVPGYFFEEIRADGLSLRGARRFGMLWFGALAAMTLALLSNNIGIMWVGIEATTLVTAFLICIHKTPESFEATWKYLIICSVGVAFAFMGTLLTGAAARGLELSTHDMLLWTRLRPEAAHLDPLLMKMAFLFLLVGYGTKAGLAPMHSWLPDAHSQAPGPVSALFSGFMLNASLYCIMRYVPLVENALGHGGWSQHLLLFFGLASVLVAAAFVVFQHDVKRLLAYSSVEHIGIMAVGLGLGGLGTFAALFHALNHSICKPLAFFAAGRLGQMYGTHDMSKLAGATRAAPVWGKAMLIGLFVLIGVAPFAVFMSEFMIVRAAAQRGAYWTMGLFLLGVGIVFVGVLRHAIRIAWGDAVVAPKQERATWADRVIVGVSLAALLLLGLWIPDFLQQALARAAQIVEGTL